MNRCKEVFITMEGLKSVNDLGFNHSYRGVKNNFL